MNAYVEAVQQLKDHGYITDKTLSQLTPADAARAVAEAGASA